MHGSNGLKSRLDLFTLSAVFCFQVSLPRGQRPRPTFIWTPSVSATTRPSTPWAWTAQTPLKPASPLVRRIMFPGEGFCFFLLINVNLWRYLPEVAHFPSSSSCVSVCRLASLSACASQGLIRTVEKEEVCNTCFPPFTVLSWNFSCVLYESRLLIRVLSSGYPPPPLQRTGQIRGGVFGGPPPPHYALKKCVLTFLPPFFFVQWFHLSAVSPLLVSLNSRVWAPQIRFA